MAKWKVGLIGNGGICKGAHLSTYLNDERLEVAAVCDIIEERAQFLKDNYFPNAKVYTDYKELLASGLVDAVIISTPHYFHPTIATYAFEKGIHVYSECISNGTMAEGVELVRAFEKTENFDDFFRRKKEDVILLLRAYSINIL